MWYVYILETKDGRLYTGITNDVERRMKAHQAGRGARFTRIFGFKKLLYTKKFRTQSKAMKRESEIKTWVRKRKLALVKNNKNSPIIQFMRNDKTLILDQKDIQELIDIKKSIHCVEEAFGQYGKGQAQMPAKIYLNLPQYDGDFRAMPAYLKGKERCVLKWVNSHAGNKKYSLPAVMAIVILSDPKNGFPLSIMEGTDLTSVRTGAAGAVAAKYLARKNSRVVSLVGCGMQAVTQLKALRKVFPVKEVKVWGKRRAEIDRFIKSQRIKKEKMFSFATIKDCVKDSDIVVTTTPSRKPVVQLEWLNPGVHINAIGADAEGKQELDPKILKKAKVVIDDWAQAAHSGEINVPLKKRLLSRRDIYAELGKIVARKKKGRVNQKEITVFDSTGLAIQDVAVANLIYETALKRKKGQWVKMI